MVTEEQKGLKRSLLSLFSLHDVVCVCAPLSVWVCAYEYSWLRRPGMLDPVNWSYRWL